ncbi:MAG: hypothetical protein H7281_16265 [Bacteriovorax sp.]|nr:hypothetical protein [Bacteriovorax sp.]
MKRARYTISLKIENKVIDEVIIDQHYRVKHPELSDWIILELVRNLNFKELDLDITQDKFQYFTVEPIFYRERPYRLILVLEKESSYIGVVNAFRVQGKKYGISK